MKRLFACLMTAGTIALVAGCGAKDGDRPQAKHDPADTQLPGQRPGDRWSNPGEQATRLPNTGMPAPATPGPAFPSTAFPSTAFPSTALPSTTLPDVAPPVTDPGSTDRFPDRFGPAPRENIAAPSDVELSPPPQVAAVRAEQPRPTSAGVAPTFDLANNAGGGGGSSDFFESEPPSGAGSGGGSGGGSGASSFAEAPTGISAIRSFQSPEAATLSPAATAPPEIASTTTSAIRSAPKRTAPKRAAPKMASPPPAGSEPAETAAADEAPPDAAPPARELVAAAAEPPQPSPSAPSNSTFGSAAISEGDDFATVKVYYGTDRKAQQVGESDLAGMLWLFAPPVIAAGLTVLCGVGFFFIPRRRVMVLLTSTGVVATAALAVQATYRAVGWQQNTARGDRVYTAERGELELGICKVSIPKDHRVGEVEAPSLLRLEVRENPEKHVVILSVQQQPNEEFYKDLSDCIARSDKREALVFVHGFNVSFDDAVRRTAQIAYDLKFGGAPICYSWPSQGSLFGYTQDENNVAWTVPDLKEFLIDVAQKTGAQRINLIAHSMGNRALTSALKELSYKFAKDGPPFNKVILAAPDVDAEIFKRDIAPRIVLTANRVTLYASSNDEALVASKKVHGYPRAGESGSDIVIAPGIDTIDVSSVDTSLLGHSYYGSSDSILADLYTLIHQSRPPDERQWLQRVDLSADLRYWVFQPPLGGTAVLPIGVSR